MANNKIAVVFPWHIWNLLAGYSVVFFVVGFAPVLMNGLLDLPPPLFESNAFKIDMEQLRPDCDVLLDNVSLIHCTLREIDC